MKQSHFAQVDELGRVILPAELVQSWGLQAGSRLRVEQDGKTLRLSPPQTSLRRVYVELTNGCNLCCATCMRNVWEVEPGFISRETFERILSGIRSYQPIPEIFIGGYGEPLYHPDCVDIVARAKSSGVRVSLITNGTLLSEDIAQRLIDVDLDFLWVSLDGASPECYADIRLGNALPGVLENLRNLQRLQYQRFGVSTWAFRPRLGIAFVAMQRNISEFPEVVRLGMRLGASEFSISNVLPYGEMLRQESLYQDLLSRCGGSVSKRWRPIINLPKMDITGKTTAVINEVLKGDLRLCLFGSEINEQANLCPFVERGSLAVRWDGKVSPCLPLMYTYPHYLDERLRMSKEFFVGDILERDLPEIWRSEPYKALRQSLEDFDFSPCVSCNSCEMADQNLEDCFGNVHPTCGGCLWAQGLIRCP